MDWLRIQKIVFILFIITIILSVSAYYIWWDEITLEEFREVLNLSGIWAPLTFILFFIFGAIFIPSTPLMAISGILFGFQYGFIYSIIASTISSIISFAIGRKLGKKWVESILENRYMSKLDDYNKKLEKGAIWDTIIFRNIPVMPIGALSILLSVSRISYRDYIIGTALGLIPSNMLAVYLGITFIKFF